MSVPADARRTNTQTGQVSVVKRMVAQDIVGNMAEVEAASVKELFVPGGSTGQVLTNSGGGKAEWSDYIPSTSREHGTDIQVVVKDYTALAAQVQELTNTIIGGHTIASAPVGRKITFTNNTASTTLVLYLTEGYPSPSGPAPIATIAPTASHEWHIPSVNGWNGNFRAFPVGQTLVAGSTQFEIGVNQFVSGQTLLRDTFNISTVPPGLGTKAANGPRSYAVSVSLAAGYSQQQAYGYNVGMRVTPPASPPSPPIILPTQQVACTSTNGDCGGSVGFPNDTAFPKQQTGYAFGNYLVELLDPVASSV